MQPFQPDPLSHPFGPFQTEMQLELESDLEAFLSAFERVAEESLWPRKDWPRHLAPLFSGTLRAMIQALPRHVTEDYNEFKDAILEHVGASEDRYRKKFRSLAFTAGARPQTVAHQLSTLGRKWLKPGIRSPDDIVELIIVEQFIQILPDGAGQWLSRRPLSSLDATVQLIEEYFMGEPLGYEEDNSNVRISAHKPEHRPEGVTNRNALGTKDFEEPSDQSHVTIEDRERLGSPTTTSVAAAPEGIQLGADREEPLVESVGVTGSAVTRFVIVNSEVIPLTEHRAESCLVDPPERSKIESGGNSEVRVVIAEPEKRESNDESKGMGNILAPEKNSQMDEGEDCFIVNHEHEMSRNESSEVVCVTVDTSDRPRPEEGQDCFIVNHHESERGPNPENSGALDVNLEPENRSMADGGVACIIVDPSECQRSESTGNVEVVCVTVEPESSNGGDRIASTHSSQDMRRSARPFEALCTTVDIEDRPRSEEGVECIIMTHSEKDKRASIERPTSSCTTVALEDESKSDDGVDCILMPHSEQDGSRSMDWSKTVCVTVGPGDGSASEGGADCSIRNHSDQVRREGTEKSKVMRAAVGPRDWSNTEEVQDCFIVNHHECEEKIEVSEERCGTVKRKHVPNLMEQEGLCAVEQPQSEGRANMESSGAEGAIMVEDSEDCMIMDQLEPDAQKSNKSSEKAEVVAVDPERLVVVEPEKSCAKGWAGTSRQESFTAGGEAVTSEGMQRDGNRKATSEVNVSDPWRQEIARNSMEGLVTGKQPALSMIVEREKYSDMENSEHEMKENGKNCKVGFLTMNPESSLEVLEWKASCEHNTEPGLRDESGYSVVQFVGIKPERQSKVDGCLMTSAIGPSDSQEDSEVHNRGPVTMRSEHNRGTEGVEDSCKINNPEPERKEVSATLKEERLTKNDVRERPYANSHSEVECSEIITNSTVRFLKLKAESKKATSDWEKSFLIRHPESEIGETFETCEAGFVSLTPERTQGVGPERPLITAGHNEGAATVKPEDRPVVVELGTAWIMDHSKAKHENTESCQVEFGTLKPARMTSVEIRERTSGKSHNDPARRTSSENFRTGVASVKSERIGGFEKYEDDNRPDNISPDMIEIIKKARVEATNVRTPGRLRSEELNTENRNGKCETISKTEEWVRPYLKDNLHSEHRAGLDNPCLEFAVPEGMSEAGAGASSSTPDTEHSDMLEDIKQYMHVDPQAEEQNSFSSAGFSLNKRPASLPYGVRLPSDITNHSLPGAIHPPSESQTEKQCFVVVNNEIIPVTEAVRETYDRDVPYSERMESSSRSSSNEPGVFTAAASENGQRSKSNMMHGDYAGELEPGRTLSGINTRQLPPFTASHNSVQEQNKSPWEPITFQENRPHPPLQRDSSFNNAFLNLISEEEPSACMFPDHQGGEVGANAANGGEYGRRFNNSSTAIMPQHLRPGDKPYECSECGKTFRFSSNLQKHLEEHAGEKLYPCMVCGKGFDTPSSLLWHQHMHTEESVYTCTVCGKSFGTASSLLWHQHIHTGEKPYPCANCEKSFRSQSNLYQHQQVHTEEMPYSCSMCERSFKNPSALQRHEESHGGLASYSLTAYDEGFNDFSAIHRQEPMRTEGKPYSCTDCAKSFKDPSALLRHKQTHTAAKLSPCPECGKTFPDPSSLHAHYQKHTGEKLHPCTECGKTFLSPSAMHQHQKMHSAEKLYTCPECGISFKALSNLHTHQRMHTGEKIYPCTECEKSFLSQSALRKHQIMHTKHQERPYPCPECGKRFIDLPSLHKHLRTHSGEKSFPCDECGKSFRLRKSLRIHYRIHTGEKPHSCTECGRCFSDPSSWRKHQRIHRREKPYLCTVCKKNFSDPLSLQKHQQIHTEELGMSRPITLLPTLS
ncbi:uncharacterized protein LOC144808548 [Lissotriton helveticus]